MGERRKVLVSGASSGIGKATAVRFAAEGWDVCLNARREKELRQVCDGLAPGDHVVCAGDYSNPATAEAIFQTIKARWGRLDVLVNCAGVSWPVDVIASPLDEWRRPFEVMLMGAVNLTRAAVRLMTGDTAAEHPFDRLRASSERSGGVVPATEPKDEDAAPLEAHRDRGRIIHVTSIHGERAERMQSSYGMVKAALNQYCRALAIELAPRGILVNAIAPGFVDTPMSIVDGVSELETEWFRVNYAEGHHLPLRRAGHPEEIAGAAYFLAGPDASYITGQVLTVDGGLTITF
jgi:3-oxoacyl-[acyl-carrier protein] reductase